MSFRAAMRLCHSHMAVASPRMVVAAGPAVQHAEERRQRKGYWLLIIEQP
uniref:Uncharacterized protein n=1 Tax=Arundo donax TaxID=35708 RepID=A0A0A8ZP90_ARUDO